MFGRSFFDAFHEDSFFTNSPQDHMRRSDDMFNSMFASPFAAIDAAPRNDQQHVPDNGRQVAPHASGAFPDMFSSMFGNMNSMMHNMQSMMGNVQGMMNEAQNSPDTQFYSQSSVMTYDGREGSQPKVYQASKSTHQAPGGIRETRKTERNTETGDEKMQIGHSIGDRSHFITRSRNRQTGASDENHNFVNVDEAEASHFDEEWQRMAQPSNQPRRVGSRQQQQRVPAIESTHKVSKPSKDQKKSSGGGKSKHRDSARK